MRVLLAALLVLTTLAGCAEESTPQVDDEPIIEPTLDLPDAAPSIDAQAMLDELQVFATTFNERAGNMPDHENARQYILDRFDALGLETYRQNFTSGIDQANLLGIKWGQHTDKWVVVGGHYDMTTTGSTHNAQSQGAYDNGSGTMMTVALAEAFANLNTTYTMVFVPFDGEERGTQGARAFVNEFVTGYLEGDCSNQPYGCIEVVGALNLDMIGLNWPSVSAPINIIDNSNALFDEVKAKATELGFPDDQIVRKPGLTLGSSDYARFWEVGPDHGGPIPTLFMISDFEELGVPMGPEQVYTPFGAYPFWHVVDTWETMAAMGGGADNMVDGFQASVDIASQLLWRLAVDEAWDVDAVVK